MSASFLPQDFAGVEADELHQVRRADRPLNHVFKSATVVAAASALWNAFISGWPMVAVSLRTISSNGLDETTLTLRSWTSIVGISLAPTSMVRQSW